MAASDGRLTLKEPETCVVAIANFLTWLHFTRTLTPEIRKLCFSGYSLISSQVAGETRILVQRSKNKETINLRKTKLRLEYYIRRLLKHKIFENTKFQLEFLFYLIFFFSTREYWGPQHRSIHD